MAFDKTPSAWITSWSEDGTDITVPIASFPQLTAAEADGTSGDIRKIIFAILEVLYAKHVSLATADRPSKLTITKTASVDTATNVLTNTYNFTIKTDILTQEVVDEA